MKLPNLALDNKPLIINLYQKSDEQYKKLAQSLPSNTVLLYDPCRVGKNYYRYANLWLTYLKEACPASRLIVCTNAHKHPSPNHYHISHFLENPTSIVQQAQVVTQVANYPMSFFPIEAIYIFKNFLDGHGVGSFASNLSDLNGMIDFALYRIEENQEDEKIVIQELFDEGFQQLCNKLQTSWRHNRPFLAFSPFEQLTQVFAPLVETTHTFGIGIEESEIISRFNQMFEKVGAMISLVDYIKSILPSANIPYN